MTWETRCAACHGWLFTVELSSGGWANVQCADPECHAYVGQIPADHLQADSLLAQPH